MAGTMGNTAKNDVVLLLFNNTTMALVGDATGIVGSGTAGSLYLALSTGTLTGASAQNTTEAAYTGYSRSGTATARSNSGWTVASGVATLAANTSFGACTAGTETETYASVGTSSSGAGKVISYAALSSNISVSSGVTPSLTTSTTFTLT